MPPHPRTCPILSGLASAALAAALALAPAARAQFPIPAPSPPPDGPKLFQNQCGTCHKLSVTEPIRQGPPLGGVFGRPAGSGAGFKYSAGFATAGFTWDAPHLDAWLTNPQTVIPGAVMAYRQANPATRKQIIDWLKDQH
jgi:cytochrome c